MIDVLKLGTLPAPLGHHFMFGDMIFEPGEGGSFEGSAVEVAIGSTEQPEVIVHRSDVEGAIFTWEGGTLSGLVLPPDEVNALANAVEDRRAIVRVTLQEASGRLLQIAEGVLNLQGKATPFAQPAREVLREIYVHLDTGDDRALGTSGLPFKTLGAAKRSLGLGRGAATIYVDWTFDGTEREIDADDFFEDQPLIHDEDFHIVFAHEIEVLPEMTITAVAASGARYTVAGATWGTTDQYKGLHVEVLSAPGRPQLVGRKKTISEHTENQFRLQYRIEDGGFSNPLQAGDTVRFVRPAAWVNAGPAANESTRLLLGGRGGAFGLRRDPGHVWLTNIEMRFPAGVLDNYLIVNGASRFDGVTFTGPGSVYFQHGILRSGTEHFDYTAGFYSPANYGWGISCPGEIGATKPLFNIAHVLVFGYFTAGVLQVDEGTWFGCNGGSFEALRPWNGTKIRIAPYTHASIVVFTRSASSAAMLFLGDGEIEASNIIVKGSGPVFLGGTAPGAQSRNGGGSLYLSGTFTREGGTAPTLASGNENKARRGFFAEIVVTGDVGDCSVGTGAASATIAVRPRTAGMMAVLGEYVTNGGRFYVCVQPGLTAGATGPTGTGSNIPDGAALWNWYEPVAITKFQKVGGAFAVGEYLREPITGACIARLPT